MKKYVVLYNAPASAAAQTENVTPKQQAKGMEGWMKWAQKAAGHIVDMGAPLMNGQELTTDGNSGASNADVRGYSVMQGENMDEVKALFEGHPHLSWNPECTIDIFEIRPLPGM